MIHLPDHYGSLDLLSQRRDLGHNGWKVQESWLGSDPGMAR